MERIELLNDLQDVFSDVLDNENLTLTEESSPQNVEDWDSLAHFQLVMELQNKYHIKFQTAEIQNWKNVGGIIDSIMTKI